MFPANRLPLLLISTKVEPKTKASELPLRDALPNLVRDNPFLSVSVDAESGEIIVHSASEQQLDAAVSELISRGIGVNVGARQVAYREVLVRPVEIDYTHKRQTGGNRQFARVRLRLEPNATGKGNEFATSIVGGTVPKEYIPGVEKGVRSVWESGVLIGFPMVNMKVTLFDGAYHEMDSSAFAFEIASRAAMTEGCDKSGVELLEPIMDVEVVTPVDFAGGIVADLNAGSALIRTTEIQNDNLVVIRANAPLARLLGYASRLHSLSHGAASHQMTFSHYEAVPRNVSPDPDDFPPAVGMRA